MALRPEIVLISSVLRLGLGVGDCWLGHTELGTWRSCEFKATLTVGSEKSQQIGKSWNEVRGCPGAQFRGRWVCRQPLVAFAT